MTAIDLTYERKKRKNDNAQMSPSDILRMALDDVTAFPGNSSAKCFVFVGDDTLGWLTYRSNMTVPEEIAHLEALKHMRTKEWVDE